MLNPGCPRCAALSAMTMYRLSRCRYLQPLPPQPVMSMIALTRAVSPSIVNCELTHLDRAPIVLEVAVEQHRQYEERLTDMGCEVVRLASSDDLPDSVFIEDTAIVLDEIAIMTRPGPRVAGPKPPQ